MTIKLVIDRNHFRAAALFAAKDDVRYYLNGVMVECFADHTVRLVATNGHALLIATQHADNDDMPVGSKWIVPIESLASFVKGKAGGPLLLKFNDAIPRKYSEISEQNGDGRMYFNPLDGKYPDYDRIIPRKYSGDVAQFNPAYLMACIKAAKVYRSTRHSVPSIHVEHNGNKAALVTGISKDAFAVVMPWRTGDQPKVLPEWFAPAPIVDLEIAA